MLHVTYAREYFEDVFHVIPGEIKDRVSGLTLRLDGANVITERNVSPGNRVVLFSWQATVGARVTKSREHKKDAHFCNGGFFAFN